MNNLRLIRLLLLMLFISQKFIAFMEKVDAVIDECFFLADFVALNLFMLDCRCLNQVISTLLHEIKDFVTDYFKALNQKENRRYVNRMGMHCIGTAGTFFIL